jgi:protocatechuate 3,4-dioxygenase alpha subunit
MASPTPPQTVGPFFSIGLPWDDGPEVVARGSDGRDRPARHRPRRRGRSGPRRDRRDLAGARASGCRGFGRCPTDPEGRWEIVTRKPAAEGGEAPHVAVAVFARGLLDRVPTRGLLRDEERGQRRRPAASPRSSPSGATLIAAGRGRRATASTSTFKGTMRPSFFGTLTCERTPARGARRTSTSDRAQGAHDRLSRRRSRTSSPATLGRRSGTARARPAPSAA